MHPQIVRKEPGSCPICDMALEPMTPSAGAAVSPELRDMTRRFWAGVVLSVPLLAMAMAEHFDKPALDALLSPHLAVWGQLILGTPAVLWGGWPFFQRGWASIVSCRLNMFTLIALGAGVAYVYSLVAALAAGIFPASFSGPEGEVALYFEAVAVIVTLVLLGQVLELRARSQTSSAIRAALDLAPKRARLLRDDGNEEDIPLEQGPSWQSAPRAACREGPGRRCGALALSGSPPRCRSWSVPGGVRAPAFSSGMPKRSS
jgi:P-type Cu+ transporter